MMVSQKEKEAKTMTKDFTQISRNTLNQMIREQKKLEVEKEAFKALSLSLVFILAAVLILF